MILVTGASGQLGQRIVRHLLARQPQTGSHRLAVSVRDPSRVAHLAEKDIEVRTGNFDDPRQLEQTFAGVDRLVMVSTDGPRAVRIAQHRNAITAARHAGVGHILYTSFLDVDPASPSEFARVHADTEAALADSGMRCTILRNGLYADFLPMTFAGALQTGVLELPAGQGRVSYISRNDLAEAIAAAALAPRLEKAVYQLTGQTAHDYADLAARVARATNVRLQYHAISEDEYARGLQAQGVPAWFAQALANMYTAAAQDRFARCTNDVAALLGHPPRSIDCLIAELFGRA